LYGFTIVELVVILLVIGIVAVFVAPNLSSTGITLPAAATRLAETIRFTQNLSMSRGQRYRINFTGSSYQITDMSGVAIIQPMTNSTAATTITPITLSGFNPPLTNGYVAFDSRGVPYVSATAALASTATITMTSGSDTATVVISPETGRVK
jgi:Tfp pilus assembly protein FimT